MENTANLDANNALASGLELVNAKGVYTAFFSPTNNKFWRSDAAGSLVCCDKDWVEEHEWFTLVTDSRSGQMLIQSDSSKRYLAVRASDSKVAASENSAALEARFKFDEFGGICAYNGKYIEVPVGKYEISATSGIPVQFIQFQVKTIAISDIDSTTYAAPGTLNGKNAIIFEQTTPETFVWLTDNDGDSYLETHRYEYLFPDNSTSAVTFKLTAIDTKNYRVKLEPVPSKPDVYGIKSNFNGKYYFREKQGGRTVLVCNADNCAGMDAQFRISLIK